MLKFLTPNNKTTLKSYIVRLGLSLAAVMVLSSPAYAGPQKKPDDPVETIDKQLEEGKDVKDGYRPIELQKTGKTAKYGLKPIKDDRKSALDKSVLDNSVLKRAQSCFKQDSGTYECICEGKKDCANLTKADICEPGTEWQNAEGFGGCSKKKD